LKDFRTPTSIEESARFIYYTRYHGKRIVNGYAGAVPAGYFALERELMTGDLARAFDGLKTLDTDFIAVHPSLLTPRRGEEVLAHLHSRIDAEEVTRFPEAHIFRFARNGSAGCGREAAL
jgi:hypothetical protein